MADGYLRQKVRLLPSARAECQLTGRAALGETLERLMRESVHHLLTLVLTVFRREPIGQRYPAKIKLLPGVLVRAYSFLQICSPNLKPKAASENYLYFEAGV